jgi:hypothetical protein
MGRSVCTVVALAAAFLASATFPCAAAAPALEVAGAALHPEYDPSDYRAGAAPLIAWLNRSADIVAHYYGRFPVAAATVRLVAVEGEGVHGGRTFADPAAFIRVQLGREVTPAQLLSDWVLVHEMTHLALPDVGEAHAWLSEGIATYVEGIARVQAGNRAESDVWAEELRSMPRGLPEANDRGLDNTHTWGRTYWGGAMFCLLADVDIRKRTGLRFGLQDALRAVLRDSGGLSSDWPIERVLRSGDAAVGTRSLEDLYAHMKDQPMAPDLKALWRELGVTEVNGEVQLDERAPLAPVRHAIMHPAAGS